MTEEDLQELTPQQRQAVLAAVPTLSGIPESVGELYAGKEAVSAALQEETAGSGEEKAVRENAGRGVQFRKAGDDGHLAAEVDTGKESLLFVSVPWERGWTARVNGEETEILRADYGFQAIAVPAGHSEVLLTYSSPLLREGIAVSAAGWLLFAVWLYIRRRKAGA